MSSVQSRLLLFLALLVGSFIVLLPTALTPPAWWPWKDPIRLGLDLQGGTHLLYQVDLPQAVDTIIEVEDYFYAVSQLAQTTMRNAT